MILEKSSHHKLVATCPLRKGKKQLEREINKGKRVLTNRLSSKESVKNRKSQLVISS